MKDHSVLAGSHTVLLGDIAGNCTPPSTNPQTVNVADGGTTIVTFNVNCQPLTPAPPVLSNLREQLIILNQCGDPYPNHSWYEYTFDYTDPNGDVTEADTRVFVLVCWSNGCQAVYESAPVFNTFNGDGFSGSITISNCLEFGISLWADITVEIWDASGTESVSPVTVRIQKPDGAN